MQIQVLLLVLLELFILSFGFKDLIQKIGVQRRVYTAGKIKVHSIHSSMKRRRYKRLKNIQLELHEEFIDVVEESRKTKLEKRLLGLNYFRRILVKEKNLRILGLIDGLGNSEQILREKFGENVEVKIFEKSKGWLAKKLSSSENQADKILNLIEERSIWQRYGL